MKKRINNLFIWGSNALSKQKKNRKKALKIIQILNMIWSLSLKIYKLIRPLNPLILKWWFIIVINILDFKKAFLILYYNM
jgi:hypothetical protein